MPFDPLRHFYKKYGYQQNLVSELVIGEKYTAVILQDGRIGVCATLGNVAEKITPGFNVNICNTTHRIILNAYFNAFLNYDNEYDDNRDIFDEIDFKSYHKVVMIGWFRTLHKKFRDSKIPVKAFDLLVENKYLSPVSEMNDAIRDSDTVILSSTTIFNKTLKEIIDIVPESSDIYMLGPSTIMHPDIFRYTRVKVLFGSIFKPHDKAVINMIRSGCGTPEFSGNMQKVFLKRPDDIFCNFAESLEITD